MGTDMFTACEAGGDGQTPAGLAGRGSARFIAVEGRPCVLRHYYRGGMIRKLSEDSFVWAGEDRTRSFHEWRLLAELQGRGLPVPRPVAARYVRRGVLYTADLITERLADVRSLASVLSVEPPGEDTWTRIGATIALFHAELVFHADLNAHNIQIDGAGRVYLLDFDRGRLMARGGSWTQHNLDRLRRSVDKVCRRLPLSFDERSWAKLLAGYGGEPAN